MDSKKEKKPTEGLEIFDGHKLGCSGVSRGKKKKEEGTRERLSEPKGLAKTGLFVFEVFWKRDAAGGEQEQKRGRSLFFCSWLGAGVVREKRVFGTRLTAG